jgi:urease accessory protein
MQASTTADERFLGDQAAQGWNAQLALRFERVESRTVLVSRRHAGPLRVQKALYPERDPVCQAIVVHPPAGIVAGDVLAIDVEAGRGTHVQVTTPGAAKWYRSTGRFATSRTTLRVGQQGLVEWLPQDTLIFDGARASIGLSIELEGDARFIGWDVTTLGRTASGERFASGSLRQRVELLRNGELAWCERAVLDGGGLALQSGAILDGAPVFGTMLATISASRELLDACRGATCDSGMGAVTAMNDLVVERYRGDAASAAARDRRAGRRPAPHLEHLKPASTVKETWNSRPGRRTSCCSTPRPSSPSGGSRAA